MSSLRFAMASCAIVIVSAPLHVGSTALRASEVSATIVDDAKSTLEKAAKTYRDLKAYQDVMTMHFVMDSDDAMMADDQEMVVNFANADGNKMYMSMEGIKFVSDGSTFTVLDTQGRQYTQNEVADKIDFDKDAGLFAMFADVHPVAMLLNGRMEEDAMFPFVSSATSVGKAMHNDKTGMQVEATGLFPIFPVQDPMPMKLWINAESGLVENINFDLTDAMKSMMKEMGDAAAADKVNKVSVTLKFDDIKTNDVVETGLFAFAPGANDKKVESFEMGGGGGGFDDSAQTALVGNPAPSFVGKGLDKDTISLADYKGKVVVLDFWATWCGPCVAAMPHIQKLHEKYADQGLVVIGMNHDRPNDIEKIRKFMKDKGVTFTQFLDHDNAAGAAYQVTGIPTTVIIDRKGVVQAIHVGFAPGTEKTYEDEIQRVLKGEDLFEKG